MEYNSDSYIIVYHNTLVYYAFYSNVILICYVSTSLYAIFQCIELCISYICSVAITVWLEGF